MSTGWSDEQVASLPIAQGRAELLEEIMSTPVLGHTTPEPLTRAPRPPRRWIVPIAAAAAVTVLASAPWLSGLGSDPTGPVIGAEVPAPLTQLVLDLPGWAVDGTSVDPDEQEVDWVLAGDDEVSVDITRMPARPGATLATYVPDYRDVTSPPSSGLPVTVVGLQGRQWSYSTTDRVVVLEPTGGFWFEVRAGGMDDVAFEELLAGLQLVDEETFAGALPDDFVTPEQAEPAVRRVLDGIASEAGVGLPPGAEQPTSEESDPYHFGADVAGAYACDWIEFYVDSRASGDEAGADEAQRVLGTSRRWPVLVAMAEQGDYPDVVWEIAADIRQDRVPREYVQGLGCDAG